MDIHSFPAVELDEGRAWPRVLEEHQKYEVAVVLNLYIHNSAYDVHRREERS